MAAYFASCHGHEADAVWIDVTLGTWGADPTATDYITFSCELRSTGAMALDAPVSLSDAPPMLGAMLTRAEALHIHRWLGSGL